MASTEGKDGEYQFYWCGWEVPFEIPAKDMLKEWPKNMIGFHTGISFTCSTCAGAVWARSVIEARVTIWECYGKSCTLIKDRWAPRPEGTELKTGGRFPADYESIKVSIE